MQNQIKAEICTECQGKGVNPKTGSRCENCRGTGAIGSDGTYEYYLTQDEKGNLGVGEVKTTQTSSSPDHEQNHIKSQSKKVLRGLIIVMLFIIYCGYLGAHFIWVKNSQILIIVTVIVFGFLVLYLLYDSQLLSKMINTLLKVFIKEPDDFLKAVQKREKKQAEV